MEEKIYQLVMETLKEVISDFGDVNTENISDDAPLLGKGGLLNSLLLVSFIADLESQIADHFGKDIILANEKAMSQSQSPFLSIKSLIKYIKELLSEE